MKIKIACLFIVGIIAIVLSIVCYSMNAGHSESNEYYGGDAYTGIQHAAAQTARNLLATNKILKMAFGSTLLVSGLTMIGMGISSAVEKEKKVKTCAQTVLSEINNPSNEQTTISPNINTNQIL